MSRSRRKTAVIGVTTAPSDKPLKVDEHRAERHAVRAVVKRSLDKDPGTSITFYVESDGRHLAAMDSQGKLLWVRNPWEDARAFCPYRTPKPVVASLKSIGGNPEHSFIAIKFDSSQFGGASQ